MDDKLRIDNRPYAEIHDTHSESNRWSKGLLYLSLGALALKGTKFAALNIGISTAPETLKYVNAGLQNSTTPWWEVAGLKKDTAGKIKAPLSLLALEGVKRFEEMAGGIPRTFGLFGGLSRSAFTTPDTTLKIGPEALDGALSHYEELIKGAGGKLDPLDKIRGFEVQPFEGKPALFRLGEDGKPLDTPVVKDVNVQVRRWFPGGVDDRFQQIIRSVDLQSENMGAHPISKKNLSNFVVTKAPETIKTRGITREILSVFGDPDKITEKVSSVLPGGATQPLHDANMFSRRMTERYMRVLDQPLEFIEETLYGGPDKTGGLLTRAKESKPYAFLKNILGTGGNYSGTTLDVWARHAFRLGTISVGVAAAYEVTSLLTNTLLDRNPIQIGGEVVAATQRTYAGISDLTGLTTLNKAQEEKAPGSGRLSAQVGFALSGYLTGRVIGGMTTPLVTPPDEMAWRIARQETSEAPGLLKKVAKAPMTRSKRFGLIGALIGGLAASPFLLGSLGSSESYDDLTSEQRGEVEVAVRKGAYWEGGRSDIEGEEISYYRPGWFRRLIDAPADELQHADLADRPFTRMVKSVTDPYWREREFYNDRPYPITGPDGSGFGPLGPLYAATLGQVIKPTRYMHSEEMSPAGVTGVIRGETLGLGQNLSGAPSALLEGEDGGGAVSPYGADHTAAEMASRSLQAIGLPGFAIKSIAQKFGISSNEDELPTLDSFADVGSMRDRFWDLNMGGMFTMNEGLRRMIPKDRQGIDWVNPISNSMPDWMPGAEHYEDFKHGDPYDIPEGEYRLPGSGYEARFPELRGVSPADYPNIHRYKILADVAPYSEQFKDVSEEIEDLASSGSLSEYEQSLFRATKAQLIERDQKVRFGEHEGVVGGYWETIKKLGRVNPVEHLLPFSPVHKTAGPLDAISEYEMRNVYSKANPSWSSPLEDFVLPAVNNAARLFGYEGVPEPEEERRDLVGYFDRLEYMKYKMLSSTAREQGEGRLAFSYDRKAEFTMYGADPFGDLETIAKVLPSEERPYLREFVAAETPEEKGRILELVPEYTRKFYIAQWQKNTYAALAGSGELSSDEQDMVRQIEASRALEGEMASVDQWDDYMASVESGDVSPNKFADYIRARRLGDYFEEESPLGAPPTDWLGYDPSVQMSGVKLKVVQSLGKDHHDFGLWDDDVSAARRQPYLTHVADELLDSRERDRAEIVQMLTAARLSDLDVEITPTNSGRTRIAFDIGSDRTEKVRSEMKRAGIRIGGE